MSPNEVRQTILGYLARGVPAAVERFEADTGRFLAAGGGWAVTNQDIIYPLALLHATEGTDCRGSEEVLGLIARGGDALRDWQDEQGRFEFIKPDGSRWGKTYMCWSMFHWLEAYALLGEALDADRRARWAEGLRLSFDGVRDELAAGGRLHNIPCWHAMTLVRASQVFDEPAWGEFGADLIGRHVAIQADEGYWPESGPTTSYNLAYVQAVGLYHIFTGDESVLGCLERALWFHLHFTYPDGSAVEAIDGRVRDHQGPPWTGWAGLLIFPEGRRFVADLVGRICADGAAGKLNTHLASIAHRFPDTADAPAPLRASDGVSIHCGRGLIRRAGPWFCCLSGYVTPTADIVVNTRNRWHMDRQNYLSVWHERAGLVIGGGNSKGQPELSTFVVVAGRLIHHAADAAELSTAGDVDLLRLHYGGTVCEVTVRADAAGVAVTLRAVETTDDVASLVAGVTLPLIGGRSVRSSNRAEAVELDPLAEFGDSWTDADGRWLEIDNVRYDMPGECNLHWPAYPYNPYAADNAAPPASATGVVAIPLAIGGPGKTVRVSVVERQ